MLDEQTIAKLKEMVGKGDDRAMAFVHDYPSMTDEEANKALTEMAIMPCDLEAERKNLTDMNAFLIKDENEAINGYDKAILLATAQGDKNALHIYEAIKADEVKHIEMLKALEKGEE